MAKRLCRLLAVGLAPVAAVRSGASEPPAFVPLGDVDPEISSNAGAVSADGSVITGRCSPPGSQRSFRWTQAGGMVSLGGPNLAAGTGASADGSTLAVNAANLAGDSFAYRWTQASGFVSLPGLTSGSPGPQVFDLSGDGSIAVGVSNSPLVGTAIWWDEAGAVLPVPNEPGFTSSTARAISGDGSVIVGQGASAALGAVGFRWTAQSGSVVLADLAGGPVNAGAMDVSLDGAVPVGYANDEVGQVAARWVGGLPDALGELPGGAVYATALGTSDNGAVIVGYGTTESGEEAFIWHEDIGLQNLKSYLQGMGVATLDNWTLLRATGVSANGKVIVGFGANPQGRTEAWMARVPVPCYANCDGSVSVPVLTANDFLCFINRYVNNDTYANCDNSTIAPILNVNDFQCFINKFSNGCL